MVTIRPIVSLSKPSLCLPPGKYSEILHGAYIAFTHYVRIPKQTAPFALYNTNRVFMYNRGRESLLHGTHHVLMSNHSLKGSNGDSVSGSYFCVVSVATFLRIASHQCMPLQYRV
jgi:hypothetical protein